MRRSRIAPQELDPERGAALIMAIGVMLMVGAITAGLLAFITTSVGARPDLDALRNRQYSADAAIETAIARVRALPSPGITACGGPDSATFNNVQITVECENRLTLTPAGYLQRNVRFVACESSDAAQCEDRAVITAQVNYESRTSNLDHPVIDRTNIQSWSVNR